MMIIKQRKDDDYCVVHGTVHRDIRHYELCDYCIDDIKILEDYTYVKKIVNIGIPSLIILILIFSGILYLNPYILGRSTSTKDLYISIVVPLLAPIYLTLQIWLCLFQQRIWVLCC